MEPLVEHLCEVAAKWTGFRLDAIHRGSVRRVVGRLLERGLSRDDVTALANSEAPVLRELLEDAATVGETYFFRDPGHFQVLTRDIAAALTNRGATSVRAWSAGCANGPEAYSLAACLRASLPSHVDVEVLGTDLVTRNVVEAQRGRYGRWAVREAGPLLHPAVRPTHDGGYQVHDAVRRLTRFERHNLLHAPSFGKFDVIFCRNVLVYFDATSARATCEHLVDSLAPGGFIFFGAVDLERAPPGLVRHETRCAQLFVRPSRHEPLADSMPATNRGPSPRIPSPTPPDSTPEPIARHLVALTHIEQGNVDVAVRVLSEISVPSYSYLPGLLELALLHSRRGETETALSLMREVLRRASHVPSTDLVAGPELLPVEFYQSSARAFIRRNRGNEPS